MLGGDFLPKEEKSQLSEATESQESVATGTDDSKAPTSHELELKELWNRKATLEYKEFTLKEELKKEGLSEQEQRKIKFALAKNDERIAEIEEKMEELETIIEQEKAFLSRGKHYDKYLAFRNIRELLKTSDIKLGQIEKEAGCQAGYMSRLEKPENATEPSIEFLITASQMLGITLDILLNVTIAYLTPTELYVIKFLEKLIRDTATDKLNWIKDPLYALKDIYEDEDGRIGHPLFDTYQTTAINSGGNPYLATQAYFPSEAFGRQTEIAGDCYHLELKNNATLYFMYVTEAGSRDDEEDKSAFELWMYDKKSGSSFLCGDHTGHLMITKLVFHLWMAIEQYMTRPRVNKDHKSIIDAFMNDDLSDTPASNESDELPF